jgi:hypothetical protein
MIGFGDCRRMIPVWARHICGEDVFLKCELLLTAKPSRQALRGQELT